MVQRFLGVLCAGVLALASASLPVTAASGAELTIRIPVDYNLDNPPGDALNEFKRVLEERSRGEIKVELFPQGSLYKGADAVQAVLRGDVELTAVVSPHWIGISPKLSIFELPFAFPVREAIYQVVDNEEFMATAYGEVEAKGGHLVGIFVYDYALLANSKQPLVAPQDFEGVKLRAIGKMNGRFLELLGAITVPVNITEVSLALERGTIEGMSTAPDFWVKYKWSESVSYATDANFLIFYYPYVANAAWWNGLGDAQRALIQGAMDEAFATMKTRVLEERAKSMAALADQGVAIHELTPAEVESWKEATAVIWSDAETEFGKELIDSLRTAAGQ